ncbi:MAG: hypothetical protein IID49_09960 [Proteobacteria bacterium]|nr:hypothetical protein [Pseudomonadota bacterium]
MLLFRLICAVMVAWAINLVLARPEAVVLVTEVPQMIYIGPIAGFVVGFFNLAKRQGWGLIVSVANGIWTGVMTIVLAGVMFLAMRMFKMIVYQIRDFDAFMRILASEAEPLIEVSTNLRLIAITLGAVAVTGMISEILHWTMVRLRRYRGEDEQKAQAKTTVARAGGPMT